MSIFLCREQLKLAFVMACFISNDDKLRSSLLNKWLLFYVMIGRNLGDNYEFKCQLLYPKFLNLIVIVIVLYMDVIVIVTVPSSYLALSV